MSLKKHYSVLWLRSISAQIFTHLYIEYHWHFNDLKNPQTQFLALFKPHVLILRRNNNNMQIKHTLVTYNFIRKGKRKWRKIKLEQQQAQQNLPHWQFYDVSVLDDCQHLFILLWPRFTFHPKKKHISLHISTCTYNYKITTRLKRPKTFQICV